MKKIILILILFFGFNISVKAANPLMYCDYNTKVIDESVYIKYRVTYYDDKTITKEIARNGETTLSESNHKTHSEVTLIKVSDNKANSTFPQIGDDFTADVMEKYYNKKACPYMTVYMSGTNATLMPTEDTSLHGQNYEYWASEGKLTMVNESGEEETPPTPTITKTCPVHTEDNAIDGIPGITAEFMMYSDGKKTVKMYFTRKPTSAQEMIIKDGEATSARLTDDRAKTYYITLSSEELAKIFKQNATQVNNNQFTCPTAIYLIEDSYSEAMYHLTTSKEEAEEYGDGHSTETEEGTGTGDKSDVSVGDKKFQDGSCKSLLGDINSKQAPAYYLNFAFNLVKYIAIILLLALTIVDFAKATASSKEEAIKKAAQATIKRFIIAVIIFFLPDLINFILKLLGIVTTDPTCGIGK